MLTRNQQKLRDKLIIKASQKGFYTYLNLANEIGEYNGLSTEADINDMARDLGEVSKGEDQESRPLLSAIVIRNNTNNSPGKGFFKMASEEVHKLEEDADDKTKMMFLRAEQKAVHEYWMNNYKGPKE